MEFQIQIFQAWKVTELGLGPAKSWKINQMVAAFLTCVLFAKFWTPYFSILNSTGMLWLAVTAVACSPGSMLINYLRR